MVEPYSDEEMERLGPFPDISYLDCKTVNRLLATIAARDTRIAEMEEALGKDGISVEPLADYAHNAWAGWMIHLFKLSKLDDNGNVIIPKHLADRWQYQAYTPYSKLPENMKPSDRKEANKMLEIIARKVLKGERDA